MLEGRGTRICQSDGTWTPSKFLEERMENSNYREAFLHLGSVHFVVKG